VPLKAKNIDTGAGLERIMAVAQGVHSNYDTDVFQTIIGAAAKVAGTEYRKNAENDVSMRVIADHLRAMTFLMVDGVMPSNEGRGYVLRRIMRRAMRHGHLLGVDKPFINTLVPTLVGVMGEAYPELQRGANMAMDVIKMEEERFGRTLKQGMSLLDDATKGLKAGDTLDGEVVFKLYDTFGFPVDLTNDALKPKNISIDEEGFKTHMEAQRQRARAAFKGSGDAKLSDVWFDVQEKTGTTEFLGYKVTSAEGVVQALVADNTVVEAIEAGSKGILVVNQTPFYAESGGQVGDTGVATGEGFKVEVTDTQKVLDGVWIHHVTVTEGRLCVGANVELKVDDARRDSICRNHTATHILFAGLREVLGEHVVQRGSRQDDKLTRFDISHPKAVTPEELAKVEQWVNERVWRNLPVVTKVIGKDEAVASGATAQFGEKYGDEVRVVYIGNPDSVNMVTADLCGGTHVGQTGEIGLFRITSESSVAAGIRRIEAVTHENARQSYAAEADLLKSLAVQLKTKASDLPERIKMLQSGADGEALRVAVEDLKGRIGSGVVLLGSATEGKVAIVAGVTKDLIGSVSAGDIVKAACGAIGGKGGGRPELAMGGGAGSVAEALAAGRGAA
ncbi:MAG: alanine--tRNA ligase, partial [Alphaproteobacteria bacterium]